MRPKAIHPFIPACACCTSSLDAELEAFRTHPGETGIPWKSPGRCHIINLQKRPLGDRKTNSGKDFRNNFFLFPQLLRAYSAQPLLSPGIEAGTDQTGA